MVIVMSMNPAPAGVHIRSSKAEEARGFIKPKSGEMRLHHE
ncbi:hypothetical protein PPEP_a4557 [Pseudoalteromonas peptidolytica F12-50-A1]|uniref:Uncharacterized protein n=1 Tax=Pseudoalteromonas peptidolytica F12-50-A1 TaxID=1315280 RepID=A0A8I0T6G6_9GAMM|nr:hypothetical protein [Pseudoalteromonas peptidolytica F12-50-A1]